MINAVKQKYQDLADCIRSDQLSARQVVEEFKANPKFHLWYKRKYLRNAKIHV